MQATPPIYHFPFTLATMFCFLYGGCADPVAVRHAERDQEKRAASIIGAMSSAVYQPLVRLVGWLFFWTFGKLFGRLDVQQTHMGMLLHAQKVLFGPFFFIS